MIRPIGLPKDANILLDRLNRSGFVVRSLAKGKHGKYIILAPKSGDELIDVLQNGHIVKTRIWGYGKTKKEAFLDLIRVIGKNTIQMTTNK